VVENPLPGAGGRVPRPAANTDVSCEYVGMVRGVNEFDCVEGVQSIVCESRIEDRGFESRNEGNGLPGFSEMPRDAKSRESLAGFRVGKLGGGGCVRWNVWDVGRGFGVGEGDD
jgi:hypothetical protein